ncbi:MAG: Zn-dependent hydrolase, partial [Bacteroidales bacterium]
QLRAKGELTNGSVEDNYITFFAGIFRSIRFGTASAHGKANMLCLNYFADHGVFTRMPNGVYTVDVKKMKKATEGLLAEILKVQGDGDYSAAQQWIADKSVVGMELQKDLDRIAAADVAKDIFFVQGKDAIDFSSTKTK